MIANHSKHRGVVRALLFTALGAALGALAPAFPFAHAQSTNAPTKEGVWLVVTHKVADFARWKPAFDGTAATKASYGWRGSDVYSIDGDRNNVMVVEEFGSMERAKAFAGSPELKAAMGKAGVVGKPDLRFLNRVAQSRP